MANKAPAQTTAVSVGRTILAKPFVTWLLVSSLLVVLGCGLLNALIDPYGLFRWVDRTGLNEIKPRATQSLVAFKYRAIDFASPKALILGNSRAEMGWDPADLPADRFGNVVNAATPGAGLQSMVPIAEHAWVRSEPAVLVVGVEFFDCLERGAPPAAREHEPVVWAANDPRALSTLTRLRAFAAEVFSLDTTIDSLQTLASQRNPRSAHLRRDGFQTARDYPEMQAIDGPRKMFLQRDRENARARVNGPKSIRYNNGELSECFAALDRLLGGAKSRGQHVFVATYPYHARLLELIYLAGLWPAYEDWKTTLTERTRSGRAKG